MDSRSQHAIDVATAIEGYTKHGAWITFRESECGSLGVGKLADLIVIDRDVFSTPTFQLMDIVVETTMFRGRIVFDRSKDN